MHPFSIQLQAMYSALVPEDMAMSSTVVTMVITDRDSGNRGRITCTIESGKTTE